MKTITCIARVLTLAVARLRFSTAAPAVSDLLLSSRDATTMPSLSGPAGDIPSSGRKDGSASEGLQLTTAQFATYSGPGCTNADILELVTLDWRDTECSPLRKGDAAAGAQHEYARFTDAVPGYTCSVDLCRDREHCQAGESLATIQSHAIHCVEIAGSGSELGFSAEGNKAEGGQAVMDVARYYRSKCSPTAEPGKMHHREGSLGMGNADAKPEAAGAGEEAKSKEGDLLGFLRGLVGL